MKKPDIKFIELVAVLLAGIGLFAIPNPLIQLLGKLTVLGSFLYALWVFLPWLRFMEEAKKIPPLFIHMLYGSVITLVLIGAGFTVYRYVVVSKIENMSGVTTPQIKSIAVLAFDDMSPDKDQEWFCDGISDAILNALTHVGDLQVPGRTSTFSFKGKDASFAEIGRQLNVESVLEGSIVKSGNRLRITAQLIKADNGFHLWSKTYNRETEDVFPLIEEISLKIVEALKVNLLSSEKAAIEKRPTEDSDAYELYLLGRHYLEMRTKEGIERALYYFNEAIKIDPDYALAHAGIADTYHYVGSFGLMPTKDAYPEAKKAADRALEIDPTLAEAYISLAIINTWYFWDFQSAKYNLDQALKFSPGNSRIYYRYFTYYQVMRQFDEGLIILQKAIEFNPLRHILFWHLVMEYCRVGRYDEAWDALDKIEVKFSNRVNDNNFLRATIYFSQGNYKDAIRILENVVNKHIYQLMYLGYAYGMVGEKEKAEKIINNIKESSGITSTHIAFVYLGMGENNKALELLEKAYEDKEPTFIDSIFFKEYDNLRSAPRFKALLKKMGLPE
jgi:adenylate cyclase